MTDAYFVTCKYGNKTAYLLGPFSTKDDCAIFSEFKEDNHLSRLSEVINECVKIDRKAHFFSYGMTKISNYESVLITGILNDKINPKFSDYTKRCIV